MSGEKTRWVLPAIKVVLDSFTLAALGGPSWSRAVRLSDLRFLVELVLRVAATGETWGATRRAMAIGRAGSGPHSAAVNSSG